MTEPLSPDQFAGDWRVLGVRLTLFPRRHDPALDLWSLLTDEQPETEEVQRARGVRTQRGRYGRWFMTLVSTAVRHDVLLEDLDVETGGRKPSTEATPISEAAKSVKDLVSNLAGGAPECGRAAIAMHSALPVSGKEQGYRVLDILLPKVDVDPDSHSLLYQINRPHQSEVVEGLGINRLCKWSFVTATRLTSVVPSGKAESEIFDQFVSVEPDVNSFAEWGDPLPSNVLPDLFFELLAKAERLVVAGDLP